jgi:hypothetical protein
VLLGNRYAPQQEVEFTVRRDYFMKVHAAQSGAYCGLRKIAIASRGGGVHARSNLQLDTYFVDERALLWRQGTDFY